jgi:hypothetical protein
MRHRRFAFLLSVALSAALLGRAGANDPMESGVPGTCIETSSGRTIPCPVRREPAADPAQSNPDRADDEIVASGVAGTCINMRTGRTRPCPVADSRGVTEAPPAKPPLRLGPAKLPSEPPVKPAGLVTAAPAAVTAVRAIPIEARPNLNIMSSDPERRQPSPPEAQSAPEAQSPQPAAAPLPIPRPAAVAPASRRPAATASAASARAMVTAPARMPPTAAKPNPKPKPAVTTASVPPAAPKPAIRPATSRPATAVATPSGPRCIIVDSREVCRW